MNGLIFAKTGSEWDPERHVHSYPIMALDLIKFYKTCSRREEIIGIQLDLDNNIIELLFQAEEDLKNV